MALQEKRTLSLSLSLSLSLCVCVCVCLYILMRSIDRDGKDSSAIPKEPPKTHNIVCPCRLSLCASTVLGCVAADNTLRAIIQRHFLPPSLS